MFRNIGDMTVKEKYACHPNLNNTASELCTLYRVMSDEPIVYVSCAFFRFLFLYYFYLLPSLFSSFFLLFLLPLCFTGTAVAQWLRCCATNRKVSGSIPAPVIGFFIYTRSFHSHCVPEVDSASNRNEYQEYFLGVKAAGA